MKTTRESAIERLRLEASVIDRAVMDGWLASRPQAVKDIVAKYELDLLAVYEIAEGAPYTKTVPGSIVSLHSIVESGEVSVLCWWIPEKLLQDMIDVQEGPFKVFIDPRWLKKIEVVE